MTDLAPGLKATPPRPAARGLAGAPPGLPAVIALVADKLALVEEECRRNLRSEFGAIDELGRYLAEGGGKRVRPILLLLSSQLCGYIGDRDVLFASVFEFIHTATLVHDDVIDQADLRRGRGSMNARWGNGLTVLLGDYLYIKSMNMALVADDIRIIKILANITLKMIEGELIADRRRSDIHLTESEHLEIIRRKTAYLFSGCGRVAGVLAGVRPERVEALADYGMNLGMAFQIIDDLLDFTADESILGKPVASDLKEGNLTLPLIYLLEKGDPNHRALVQAVLDDRDFRTVSREEIIGLVRQARTLERTRALAHAFARRAREALAPFEPCPAREALLALPEFVISREY
ncbi:MAG TPA: polyprenyl synthetase family protein [Candidatus Polarisedimenticolia bacterium]|nr:polyprenyl synthetase family protein [Candidatus Polarisedimenticolia bacterium]